MSGCGCGEEKEETVTQLRGRNLLKLIRGIPKKDSDNGSSPPSEGMSKKDWQDKKDGEEIIIKTETMPQITISTDEGLIPSTLSPEGNCEAIEQLSIEAQLEKKRLDYLLARIEELRCKNDFQAL